MSLSLIQIARPAPSARPAHLGARLIALISLARQRHALARLDKAALHDLGLTEDQARAEAARPVWDAPAHWMR